MFSFINKVVTNPADLVRPRFPRESDIEAVADKFRPRLPRVSDIEAVVDFVGPRRPRERDGETCVCGKSLPPCKSFDNLSHRHVDRKVDNPYTYIFNGGMYYRIEGSFKYYCPECFWKPEKDYIRKQERRREEEQRRKREIRKEEELKRRQQEAKEEAMRREALRQEAEKRIERRIERLKIRKQRDQAHFEYQLSKKESPSQKFVAWTLKNDSKAVHQIESVQIQSYEPSRHSMETPMDIQMSEDSGSETFSDETEDELSSESSDDELSVSSEDELSESSEDEEADETETLSDTEVMDHVAAMISEIDPSEELDDEWLNSAQALLIHHFSRRFSSSPFETETLLHHFAHILSRLSSAESLSLTKALSCLRNVDLSDIPLPTALLADLSISCKFSLMLLYSVSHEVHCDDNSQWMQLCFDSFVPAVIEDEQLERMMIETSYALWSKHDCIFFMQQCITKRLTSSVQKHILHLAQTYRIEPDEVNAALKAKDIIRDLNEKIQNEPEKLLGDILYAIKQTGLVEEATLNQVRGMISMVYEKLDSLHIELDYGKHLKISGIVQAARSAFKQFRAQDIDSIAGAIVTLMCAVQKSKGFCPRQSQLVAFLILLHSSEESTSRLLEVLTGEGKSCIIAMFAAVLAIQEKHVDIITSSPILACRDAEEWESFYDIFGLKAAHNTDIKRESAANDADSDEQKQACYKHHIVYGTMSKFSADVLREEFEQKEIRCGRPFEAVIVDEVDLLMLDEGVQFTYLCHNAAVLHHIEPVLAAVWAVIGQYRPAKTVNGSVLYVGSQKIFTDAIFECLDPAQSGVEDPSQLLAIAKEVNLITDEQLELLMGNDAEVNLITDDEQLELLMGKYAEAKCAVLSSIEITDSLHLIAELKNYIPHAHLSVYTVNEEGLLVADDSEHESETSLEVSILLLENGMACMLYTQEELKEGVKHRVEDSFLFSDDECKSGDENKDQVKLPSFLKEFVLNQIPVYVHNAVRALQMAKDREYAISEDRRIIPVDFQNSGMMEMNKKWGGGLQQMLEMKHNLSLSSLSVVTNFMSNIEFFSRYKDSGGIYGLSGTLGLDSTATSKVLHDLFDVQICSIPTNKQRKLYEKPPIVVEGGNDEWFQKITTVANEATKKETWKAGRAVLVLCEDIRTAENLKAFVLNQDEWTQGRVHLYAHSNSKELNSFRKKFVSGEMIIATNLAGRGTDIGVTDEVDKSGGLLCLLTFLPRNRRVELQVFGRTGRKGKPGSVQCVFKASSLPYHYQGLDIKTIRKLRAEEETLRLDELMKSDVREVQLRETLFKHHCKFLQRIHRQMGSRDDKSVVVSSLNESWGQWLQMKSQQVEQLEEEELIADLSQAQHMWQPTVPSDPSVVINLPFSNFYHLIKFGNQLLIQQEKENAERASFYYTESINKEPTYAIIAYYNRAYCIITMKKKGYKDKALSDLNSAKDCIEPYINEVLNILQCVCVVGNVRGTKTRECDSDADDFTTQMQVRLQVFGFIRTKIHEAIDKIKHLKDEDVEAKPVGIFSLIPDADYITNKELSLMWTLGLEVAYSIEKEPKFCWSGLICFGLGIAQLAAGVLLTVFTVGAAANIGMFLITEGISDCISGIEGMVTGEFSWTEYAISKAMGLAISLVSGGIGRLADKGLKAFKVGSKAVRHLRAIPKIAKNSWEMAAKASAKVAAKYAAKEVALQGISYALKQFCEYGFEKIVKKFGGKCKQKLMEKLRNEFTGDYSYLRRIVDQEYIEQLPESYVREDKMSPGIQKQALDFFASVGNTVVHKLVSESEVKEHLKSAALSLFGEISHSKNPKVAGAAILVEVTLAENIIEETVEELGCLTERFIPETEKECKKYFHEQEGRTKTERKHGHLRCADKLKADLANHVGDIFSDAVAALLQQNLGSLVNHGFNRSVDHQIQKCLRKRVFKSDRTLEKIKAAQHANYIRSVEPTPSRSGSRSTRNVMVSNYARHIASEHSPGSLLDLRVAVEHYGKEVIIYQKRNGKLVRDCSIDPFSKKVKDKIELIYTPPPDGHSVGHYDVLVNGRCVRVNAENKNCLFHAFSLGQNPHLSPRDLKQEAQLMRETVSRCITEQPRLWNSHVELRIKLEQVRRGNHFALIGGMRNSKTKIVTGTYKEEVNNDCLTTNYKQCNGVTAEMNRNYVKNIEAVKINKKVKKRILKDNRLTYMNVHMENLSLEKNNGKRCWATLPVTGQLKKVQSHSFHLCPSRAGANCGGKYCNAIMSSPRYNEIEKRIWTKPLVVAIGKDTFSMTVLCKVGPLIPKDKEAFFKNLKESREARNLTLTEDDEKKLTKRFALIQQQEPRVHRAEGITFIVHFPSPISKDQADKIEVDNKLPVTVDTDRKNVVFTMPMDYDLHVPKDCSKLKENGELHDGEITNATPKLKDQTYNVAPKYYCKQTYSIKDLKRAFRELPFYVSERRKKKE